MDRRITTVAASLALLLVTLGSASPRPVQETIRCTSSTTSKTDVNFSSRDTVTRSALIRSRFCYNLKNVPSDDPLHITLEAKSGEFDLLAVPRRTTSASTTQHQLNAGDPIEAGSRSSCQSFTIEDPARSYTVVVVARGSGSQRFSLTFGAGGSPAKTCPQHPGVSASTDPDVLAHMSYAPVGGGGNQTNVCDMYLDGVQEAELSPWTLDGPLDDGDLVRVRSIKDTYMDSSMWSLGWFPAICGAEEDYLDGAEAISPSGERLEAISPDFHFFVYGVWLPPEAYLQPGIWQLVVDNRYADMSLRIDVPPADEPVVIEYEDTFWLAGYEPGERIKAVIVDKPLDEDHITVVGEFDLRADANGYAVAEDPTPGVWESQYFFLGEWGNVSFTQSHSPLEDTDSGQQVPDEDVAEFLLDNYPIHQVCSGFIPSRLIIGDTARVTSGHELDLRDEPGGVALLDEMPGGSTLTVLAGPACTQDTAFWEVNYRGLIGWTAEGFNDEYWLEPVP